MILNPSGGDRNSDSAPGEIAILISICRRSLPEFISYLVRVFKRHMPDKRTVALDGQSILFYTDVSKQGRRSRLSTLVIL